MYKRIESTYDGECCNCGREYEAGQEIFYHATAQRGKRSYCVPCGEPLAGMETTSTPTLDELRLDELQRLKAKLAAMEADKDQEAPKPTVSTTQASDPLAVAIAKAIEPMIQGKLDKAEVIRLIKENTKTPAHTIVVKRPDMPAIDLGRQHRQFEELMLCCNARTKDGQRLNVWLVGAAGTGKTSAAANVAKALGLKFFAYGSLTDTIKLFGYISPGTGQYVRTPFREGWEHGGVIILDDFDGSDQVAALEMNAPLANGHYTFPDGVVARHEDCVIILTANTFGTGATNDYVGRVRQDAAFLDRFVTLEWGIDEELERDTCANQPWVEYVQRVRANVRAKGLKVLVTPRATYYGESLLAAGLPLERVKAMAIRKSMTADQWGAVC